MKINQNQNPQAQTQVKVNQLLSRIAVVEAKAIAHNQVIVGNVIAEEGDVTKVERKEIEEVEVEVEEGVGGIGVDVEDQVVVKAKDHVEEGWIKGVEEEIHTLNLGLIQAEKLDFQPKYSLVV